MTDQHPITPPPELLQQWATEYWGNPGESIGCGEKHIATQAARWGADQELEACCSIALTEPCCGTKHQRRQLVSRMRELRRPKPPSLKLQALTAMLHLQKAAETTMDTIEAVHIICRALEALPND
jgi:hypothetical protein